MDGATTASTGSNNSAPGGTSNNGAASFLNLGNLGSNSAVAGVYCLRIFETQRPSDEPCVGTLQVLWLARYANSFVKFFSHALLWWVLISGEIWYDDLVKKKTGEGMSWAQKIDDAHMLHEKVAYQENSLAQENVAFCIDTQG